jgi:hypothetical protein
MNRRPRETAIASSIASGSRLATIRSGSAAGRLAPQRSVYKPLSVSDPFATIVRVAGWLRASIDFNAMPHEDAEVLQQVWGLLMQENPLERSISTQGIEQLNRLVSTYLPIDLNHDYQPARIYAPTPDSRFEISCLKIEFPRMRLAIARIPRKRTRVREFNAEVDESGMLRKMWPDPTKGIRRMFDDSERGRAEIIDFLQQVFELDRKRRGLS